jgi:hypothetical protein
MQYEKNVGTVMVKKSLPILTNPSLTANYLTQEKDPDKPKMWRD